MENEKDRQKQEFEKRLEEIRQNISVREKKVEELHLQFANQINEGTLDMPVFITEVDSLEESVRDNLLARFINRHNGPHLLRNQSMYEIIRLIDYLNINNYFNRESSILSFNHIDFFSSSNYQYQVMLYLFKNISVLGDEAAGKLARTEEGVDELINILRNNEESKYHRSAVYALANELVPSFRQYYYREGYLPSKNEDASLKIPKILQECVSSLDDQIGIIASQALLFAKDLSKDNIEYMLRGKNPEQKKTALEIFRFYNIGSKIIIQLIPMVIDLLEDEKIDVSQAALKAIENISPVYSSELVDFIIDLLIIRSTKRPHEFFNTDITVSALKETFKHNPRLYGQTLHKLRDIAFESNGNARTRAVFSGAAISKKGFLALVDEIKDTNPKIANSIANIVSGSLERIQILTEISQTDPKDIQQNAANQLNLLTRYYESGLAQAKNSFNWAIGITVFCVLSFLTIVIIFGRSEDKTIIWLSAFASGVAEIIAGTLLAIYRQSLSQLNNYNHQMSRIQNYLLANSFIESLSNEAKDNARLDLIKSVSLSQTNLNDKPN